MDDAHSFISSEFGGWPFLDDDFPTQRLLTIVACVRLARRDGTRAVRPRAAELLPVLTPDEAVRIRRLDLPHLPVEGSALPTAQQELIQPAVRRIIDHIPEWEGLFTLPVRYLAMPAHRRAISASNFAWPQHILLSNDAFSEPAVLDEQLLHETSHQWLYLCEELAPLQQPHVTTRITLPSGTSGRSPAELLGALHVVVNLHRLWLRLDVAETVRRRRLDHLVSYRSGCLDLLDRVRTHLTPDGRALAHRLHQEALV